MTSLRDRLIAHIHPRARSVKFWTIAAVAAVAMTLGLHVVRQHWAISYSPEAHQSLSHSVFLVELDNKETVRGQFIGFRVGPGLVRYTEGTGFMKVLVGLPGDRVSVTEVGTLVNGVLVGGPLDLARQLKQPASAFVREEIVPPGKLFVVGTEPHSYDSRYWGFVDQSRVIGKGHPLW